MKKKHDASHPIQIFELKQPVFVWKVSPNKKYKKTTASCKKAGLNLIFVVFNLLAEIIQVDINNNYGIKWVEQGFLQEDFPGTLSKKKWHYDHISRYML